MQRTTITEQQTQAFVQASQQQLQFPHSCTNERRRQIIRDARLSSPFARPGETQAHAIERYMAGRKRAWRYVPPRTYPNWPSEIITTRAYVELWRMQNGGTNVHTLDFLPLSDNPQPKRDAGVIVEYVDAEPIDAGAAMDLGRLCVADHFAQRAAA